MDERTSNRPRRARPEQTAHWSEGAALLPVLAAFLGGATEKWAEGLIVAGLGLLLLLRPPRYSLGRVFNGVALAFAGCTLVAFLPARWFFLPAWRVALTNDFGIALPATVSPQPWLTWSCCVSLIAGLAWLYYVCAQELETAARRRQLRLFAGGVAVLAGLSVALYLAHRALPFWRNERGFGPFPNRNQTADLLAISAIVILACGEDAVRHGRKAWLFWLAGLALVVTGLVLNFSRAGLVILVLGSVLWLGLLALRGGSPARLAVGLSAMLVLLAVVLLFGGATLERFHLRGGGTGEMTSDFRWLIFRDARQLISASPWCGLGLGNFDSVFAIFRSVSANQSRALHPESDWLWAAAELGWPAVGLILLGAILLARRFFPLADGSAPRLRAAAFIGALLFAAHGLADVSAHRVGSAYAGIFLFGLALRRPRLGEPNEWLARVFRVLGAGLLVAGATWFVSSVRGFPLPGGLGVKVEKQLAADANAARDFQSVIAHASRGSKWAPLDWQLYFLRGLARVGANHLRAEALADFRRARFLEPNSFEVPYQEGLAWITHDPLLAVTAWREALRRAGPESPALYERLLSSATQWSPRVRRRLEDFGSEQPDLALAFLGRATGSDFTAALGRVLACDPGLQSFRRDQQERLFRLWGERGDGAGLLEFIGQDPARLALGWAGVAREKARRGDFRGAMELAERFALAPRLPVMESKETTEELQRKFFSAPNDYGTGLALYQRLMEEGKTDDALLTLRRCNEQANAPAYFLFLEAQAWAKKEDWERAWSAFVAYKAK